MPLPLRDDRLPIDGKIRKSVPHPSRYTTLRLPDLQGDANWLCNMYSHQAAE